MRVITYFKIGYFDWLYFLFYEVIHDNNNFGSESFEQETFDDCRKRRFRFENRSLLSEAAVTDMSFQYGNYHMAKMNLKEDFVEVPVNTLGKAVSKDIFTLVNENVPTEEKGRAIDVISKIIDSNILDDYTAYKLNLEAAEKKRSPFDTFEFFQSYLLFGKNDRSKLIYLEFGCD